MLRARSLHFSRTCRCIQPPALFSNYKRERVSFLSNGDQRSNTTNDRRADYISKIRTFFDDEGKCTQTDALRNWVEDFTGVDESRAVHWVVSYYNLTVNPSSAHNVIRVFQNIRIKPTVDTYVSLIQGYCKNNQLKEALSVYQEAVNLGYQFNDVNHNMLINLCLRGNRPIPAAQIAMIMKKVNQTPDMITLHELIKQLVVNGNVDELKILVEEIEDEVSLVKLKFNEILADHAWAYPDRIELLCKLLEFTKFEPESKIFARIIGGYIRLNQLDSAVGVADSLLSKGIPLSYPQLNSLLAGCIMKGYTREASRYMEQILTHIPRHSGGYNHLVTVPLTTMVSGLLDLKEYESALNVLRKTNQITGHCDIILLEELFKAATKDSKYDISTKCITEFVGFFNSSKKSEPLKIIRGMYEDIIYRFIRDQKLAEAQELVSQMKDKGYENQQINVRLFNSLVHGDSVNLVGVVEEFEKVGMEMQSSHYNMVISKCLSVSPPLVDEAIKIFEYMKNKLDTVGMTSYMMVLGGLVQSRKPIEVFCDEIQAHHDSPSSYSLSNLCRSVIEEKSASDTLSLLSTLEKKFSFVPDSECFLMLFAKAMESNDLDSMVSIISLANRNQIDPLPYYRAYIKVLLDNKQFEKARDTLKEYVCSVPQSEVSEQVTSSIFNELICNGLVEDSLELLKELKGKIKVHFSILPSLITYYLKKGKFGKAEKTLELMDDYKLEPDISIFMAFLDGYRWKKRVRLEKLLETVELLKEKGLEITMPLYAQLIKLAVDKKESLVARDLYLQMCEKKMLCDSALIRNVIVSLLHQQNFKEAKEIVDRCRQLNQLHPSYVNALVLHAMKSQNSALTLRYLKEYGPISYVPDSTLIRMFNFFSVAAPLEVPALLETIKHRNINLMALDYSNFVIDCLENRSDTFQEEFANLMTALQHKLATKDIKTIQNSIAKGIMKNKPSSFLGYHKFASESESLRIPPEMYPRFFEACEKSSDFHSALEGYFLFPSESAEKTNWDSLFCSSLLNREEQVGHLFANFHSIPFSQPYSAQVIRKVVDLGMKTKSSDIILALWDTLCRNPQSISDIQPADFRRFFHGLLKRKDYQSCAILFDNAGKNNQVLIVELMKNTPTIDKIEILRKRTTK